MQRSPERQYASGDPAHSRPRPRGRGPGPQVRWLIALGAASTLGGEGLVIGLGGHPASRAAPKGHTPQAAAIVGQADLTQFTFRHPSVAPLTPAPVATSARPSPHVTQAQAAKPAAPSAAAQARASAPPVTAAGAPQATAEYQTPRGANQLAWSEAILNALGDPLTSANIISIGYWMQNEAGTPPSGIVGADNPINVSQPGYGGWPIKSEGNGYNLYSYPSPQAGIQALVAYLTPTGYPQILAALKSGAGLSSPSLAGELSEYSGGGYTAIPDAWGASQGKPQT
jgi:hypothetical protein